jgi:hypothetical protein
LSEKRDVLKVQWLFIGGNAVKHVLTQFCGGVFVFHDLLSEKRDVLKVQWLFGGGNAVKHVLAQFSRGGGICGTGGGRFGGGRRQWTFTHCSVYSRLMDRLGVQVRGVMQMGRRESKAIQEQDGRMEDTSRTTPPLLPRLANK